jgi:hypothetical protein
VANKARYVIWAHREAKSLFGPASNPVIRNGALLFFTDRLQARCECDSLNSRSGNPHLRYTIKQTREGGRNRQRVGAAG